MSVQLEKLAGVGVGGNTAHMCMTACTGVGAQLQELGLEGAGNTAHICMTACIGVGAQLQELEAGGKGG